jgi:hypothetical protein
MNKQTAQLLEQHFDTAFAAPGGVAKLRELILTLAMQGKLVEQDPNDPPASELLKEIEVEKQRLVKAGKIKKPKPLPLLINPMRKLPFRNFLTGKLGMGAVRHHMQYYQRQQTAREKDYPSKAGSFPEWNCPTLSTKSI